MSYVLEFEIDILPRSQINTHGHWRTRAKEKKEIEALVAVYARPRPKSPLKRAQLFFTRFSSAEPDFTNLVASFKGIEDGLVKAGIIEDDCPAVVGHPSYDWEKARPKHGKVRVIVEEVSDE